MTRANLILDQACPRAYARFRKDERHPRLTFVARNGGRRARTYFEIREIEWNPDASAIVLTLLDTRITIEGRNLVGLAMLLEEHEVGLIQERHAPELLLAPEDVFVERISWDAL